MKRIFRKLTSTMLMAALLGTLTITNAQAGVIPSESTVTTVTAEQPAQCQTLSAAELAAVHGAGWVEDLVLVVDVHCAGGSLLSALGKVSPYVGAFCAGWMIGRLITD